MFSRSHNETRASRATRENRKEEETMSEVQNRETVATVAIVNTAARKRWSVPFAQGTAESGAATLFPRNKSTMSGKRNGSTFKDFAWYSDEDIVVLMSATGDILASAPYSDGVKLESGGMVATVKDHKKGRSVSLVYGVVDVADEDVDDDFLSALSALESDED